MSIRLVSSFSRISFAVMLLAACGDDGAGAGGAGGLEPCTETCASTGNGDGDGDGGGDGDGDGGRDGDGGDGTTASSSTGDGGAPAGPTSSSGGEGGSGAGGSGAGGAPGEGLLVINELSAAGDDWIEIFNAGDADLDVGGLRIADQEEPGVPKLDEAIEIPAGTTLEAGAYLFILADQDAASDGFVDACDPGPSPCLVSAFGLSAGGDEVFVVDGDDAIVLSVEYPADATVEGESWGRLPNGTGDFEVNVPTPGDDNEAP